MKVDKFKRVFWGYRIREVDDHMQHLNTEYDKKVKGNTNKLLEISADNYQFKAEIKKLISDLKLFEDMEENFNSELFEDLEGFDSELGQIQKEAEEEKARIKAAVDEKSEELALWHKKLDQTHRSLAELVKSLDEITEYSQVSLVGK